MSDNVTALYAVNTLAPDNASIARQLRRLADDVERGVFEAVDTVVCTIEAAGGLERVTFGKPIDRARVVGLLAMAAWRAAEED